MPNPLPMAPMLQNQQGLDLKKWMFRIKKLVPWFILSFLLFLSGAWLYLRLTEPIYKSAASVLIRSTDNNEDPSLKDLKIINAGKVIENEVKVLKSPDLMKEVVISEKLYIEIKTDDGLVAGKRKIYKTEFPLNIDLQSPEKIEKNSVIKLKRKGNEWLFSTGKPENFKNIVIGSSYSIDGNLYKFLVNDSFTVRNGPLSAEYILLVRPLEAVAWDCANNLIVAPSGKTSSVVDLSFTDHNPIAATKTLDALLKIYNRKSLEEKNAAGDNTLKFLNDRLELIKQDLDKVEANVQSYKTGKQVNDVSSSASQYLDNYNTLDQLKTAQETELNKLNGLARELASRPPNTSLAMSPMGVSDASLNNLIQQHNQILLNRERLEKIAGEKNPGLVDVENQLVDVKSSINSSIRDIRNSYNISLNDILGKKDQMGALIRSVPRMEKDLGQITRDHSVQEQIYLFLLQKREERAMTVAANISDARTIAEPTSLGKTAPVEKTIWGAAIILALAIPIGISFLLDIMDNKVGDKTEVSQKTIVPLIGEISNNKRNKVARILSLDNNTLIAEQFRTLRTELHYSNSQPGKRKVVLVTSEGLGEGKSFISLNLAASYSLLKKSVVILEFDLRRPGLSEALALNNEDGITNYIDGNKTLDSLLIKIPTANGNLSILPAGQPVSNPSELIASTRTFDLLEEIKKQFDYIIIDTPPLGLVTDAKLLQDYADITLFVLRQGYTEKDIYPILNERQLQRPDQATYVVLNGVNKNNKHYKTGRYASKNAGYYNNSLAMAKKDVASI